MEASGVPAGQEALLDSAVRIVASMNQDGYGRELYRVGKLLKPSGMQINRVPHEALLVLVVYDAQGQAMYELPIPIAHVLPASRRGASPAGWDGWLALLPAGRLSNVEMRGHAFNEAQTTSKGPWLHVRVADLGGARDPAADAATQCVARSRELAGINAYNQVKPLVAQFFGLPPVMSKSSAVSEGSTMEGDSEVGTARTSSTILQQSLTIRKSQASSSTKEETGEAVAGSLASENHALAQQVRRFDAMQAAALRVLREVKTKGSVPRGSAAVQELRKSWPEFLDVLELSDPTSPAPSAAPEDIAAAA